MFAAVMEGPTLFADVTIIPPPDLVAIIKEDGTGVAGANSYVDIADVTAYAASQIGWTFWGAIATDDLREQYILTAMEWYEATVSWCGAPVDCTQALNWPRTGAVGPGDCTHASTEVPDYVLRGLYQLIKAVYQRNEGSAENPLFSSPSSSTASSQYKAVNLGRSALEVEYKDSITADLSELVMPEFWWRMLGPCASLAAGVTGTGGLTIGTSMRG